MSASTNGTRPGLLIVGAFPDASSTVVGGMVTNCRILRESELASLYDLVLVDSTQKTNPPPPAWQRGFYAIGRLRAFVRALRGRRPRYALIFCSVGFSLVEKAVMAALCRLHGTRSALYPLGGQIIHETAARPWLKHWYRLVFAASDTVLCQGAQWMEYFTRDLEIPPRRLALVTSWTATPELMRIGAGRAHQDAPPLRLVFIGWLEREKGVQELVRVFARLRRRYDIRLSVIGGGSQEPAMRDIAEAEGVAGDIDFHGWLSGGQVGGVLGRSDLFVLPSWGEGMPNSLIEAMAAKVPVVVTAVGAVPDFIRSGENGLLVPPRDEAALERAIAALLEDPEMRRRFAENAYVTAHDSFTIERTVEQLRGVFA